jgi:phosphopantothenate-cysteine ligase
MAVSDYRARSVTDAALLSENVAEALHSLGPDLLAKPGAREDALAETIAQLVRNAPQVAEMGKIRSTHDDLVVVFEKTTKVISLLRGLLPEAVIVGFKLLVDASADELIKTGLSMLKDNDCDFVLANDMKTVTAGAEKHEGILIDKDGASTCAEGKRAIAELIVSAVTSRFAVTDPL